MRCVAALTVEGENKMKTKHMCIMSLTVAIAAVLIAGAAFAEVSKEVHDSISTPNSVTAERKQ